MRRITRRLQQANQDHAQLQHLQETLTEYAPLGSKTEEVIAAAESVSIELKSYSTRLERLFQTSQAFID